MYKVYITKKEVHSCKNLHQAIEKIKDIVDMENCNITYEKGFNVLECVSNDYEVIISAEL